VLFGIDDEWEYWELGPLFEKAT